MKLSNKKSIAIAVGIVVLGIVAYFLWLQPDDAETISVVSEGPASGAQATFLNLIIQLEPVAFDASVLTDRRFLSLVDIHVGIVPETAGRIDPFAPLSGTR